MSALSYLARRFVAGENMAEAVRAVKILNQDGIATTLDVLGENVTSKEEAEDACRAYLDLLDEIDREKIRSHCSLKLTQMGLDIGEEFCLGQMRKILKKAKEKDNFLRIDMEGSAYTERTLRVFKTLQRESSDVGIVVQAYLYRTEADVKELASLGAQVRVCKGAYKESSAIAWHCMDDIRRSYQSLVEILLKAGCKTAIATHDEKLIRWAVDWTAQNKIPREQFEFQMLYGLRRKRARELEKAGYAVRSYVPFGTHWLPYFVRRLRERKENIFFVLKSLVAD